MRLAIDIMGGDHGPDVIIRGALNALQRHGKSIREVHLVGDQSCVDPFLKSAGLPASSREKIRVLHTTEVLQMDEKPVEGLRRKKKCSLALAVDLAKDKLVDAVISPGNTGGVVAASTIKLRNLPGVDRAGIATVMPRPKGEFLMLDVGANADARPSHLVHYAIMGAIYASHILRKDNPRVGLLSVGTEKTKGNELTLETLPLLEATPLNFIGNVEGHDLFRDSVDVVVCDGFTGNVVLKSCESLATCMFGWIKQELTATPVRKLGAMLARSAFKPIRTKMDPDTYGGAPLLGVNGNVLITHGSARETAIENAVGIAIKEFKYNINQLIIDQIQDLDQPHRAA